LTSFSVIDALRLLFGLSEKKKMELTEQKAAFAHLIGGQQAIHFGHSCAPVPA